MKIRNIDEAEVQAEKDKGIQGIIMDLEEISTGPHLMIAEIIKVGDQAGIKLDKGAGTIFKIFDLYILNISV